MNIAYVSSEVVPWSKTGGLADVAGSLPEEMMGLGHQAAIFTPYYRSVKKIEPKARQIAAGVVPVGTEAVPWTLHQAASAKTLAQTYFIGCDKYFDRDGLYGTPQGDYADSCSRFVFFSRACLAAAQALGRRVDIWHCHDWQSAMIPVYLRLQLAKEPFHAGAAAILTVHNLAYQGLFWHWDWPLLNLPWAHFNWKELEFHGRMNLLKGGLVHADALTTVSPTYAREIQTPAFGCGLEGVLAERKSVLFGIVNGIDAETWNPRRDPLIPANYGPDSLEGKRQCKEALRRKFELASGDAAVIGMIGRLVEQKGFDLVAQCVDDLLRRNVQLVILGTGSVEYHEKLERVRQSHPGKVAVALAFDDSLAHLIEAASDLFLMPSRYEPCGLNQLYSLAYGTPPLVHRVGGLADTVTDTTPETFANATATGFTFSDYTPPALLACLDRALQYFTRQPEAWAKIQFNGMVQNWSWRRSAQKYLEVYEVARGKANVQTQKVV